MFMLDQFHDFLKFTFRRVFATWPNLSQLCPMSIKHSYATEAPPLDVNEMPASSKF